jgi:MSHA biogenesis protein MshJ
LKEILKRYAERIDNATLRERAWIFLGLAVVLVFLFNALLIDPLRARQKTLAAESVKLQQELVTVQAGLQGMLKGGSQDIDTANRARQTAARDELSKLNSRIGQEQRRFTPPDRMRATLAEMLERNKRLGLVDLKTLPVTPLAVAAAGTSGNPGLFRHGIELTVGGSYVDLYEYLQALERLPTQLYWGHAELAVGEYPAVTLKLTLYTVSFDRAWLIV